MILIDWLAESESHFLVHIIVITRPINYVQNVTLLPFIIVHVHNRDLITIHCYEINRTSWKWKILTNREANNQSKSIEVHILPFQATSVETFVLAFTIYVHVANQHIVYYFHEQIYNQADTQCEKDPITLRYHA